MSTSALIRCDGCGQTASPEHIAQRLRRLEWTTRFRPVHINTLLLGAFPPEEESEFLYAAPGVFRGEAALLLDALEIPHEGKTGGAVAAEFQRRGFFLAHVLECPLVTRGAGSADPQALLEQRLPAAFTRIRRSLKPKRVVIFSDAMEPVVKRFTEVNLGCPVVLNDGHAFVLHGAQSLQAILRLRAALASGIAATP